MDNHSDRDRLLSRRRLLAGAAIAGAAALLPAAEPQPEAGRRRSKLIGFSKPFQSAGPTETADIVAQIGWDGIECPVRPKGQIEPERVEDELPKFVEALKKVGREVVMITTAIKEVNPLAEKVLRTASKLGIRRYRLGFWTYSAAEPIEGQIANIRAAMRDLAALNKELGLCGGHQNHSGANYFGAPLWDLHESLQGFDPKQLGVCFDIGHATIEGGLSWPLEARLLRPFYAVVYVKDFVWHKGPQGWDVQWRPLGEGMVDRRFFQTLKQTGYDGPISQHHEYEVGSGPAMIQAMKNDLDVLRRWMDG